ncbi:Aminomethyltransferase [Poriferisphaera corsica]|uniref:Aminomethyltransferase n=1 Tax=Poriferisphaera corsica TaxID=2528020 RepID=A0A517YYE9_9BACT|nr:glycine cleavage T C-terminal barrel domain-containing protein [Poriferisphaera corsica]QDU35227.1 Aminomethyltransferase [Poriferisphaera corsica]
MNETHENGTGMFGGADEANPLMRIQEKMGGMFIAWGGDGGEFTGVPLVESFDEYYAEYAAIRQRVGILHMPQRTVVKMRGSEACDFLHRMNTNDVNGLKVGESNHALLLNQKGRIDVDMIVMKVGEDELWLEVDQHNASRLIESLDKMIFTEDIEFEDCSDQLEHIALHGPAGVKLLEKLRTQETEGLSGIELWEHREVKLHGVDCRVYRRDDAGSLGLHVLVPRDALIAIYGEMVRASGWEAGAEVDAEWAEKRREGLRGRPIGWMAYNTARIEAGTPIWMIDYGTDSLPAETGIIDELVSFTKGCYLGQEIVARMHSRGHPKRILVGLKLDADKIPVAGSAVTEEKNGESAIIGGITSSTASPLLGNQSIALAVMKWGKHRAGSKFSVVAEEASIAAETCTLGVM